MHPSLSVRTGFYFYYSIKGPMTWPFLLIIIPLLRSTRIYVYCAVFQTHIGFSYSTASLYSMCIHSLSLTACWRNKQG